MKTLLQHTSYLRLAWIVFVFTMFVVIWGGFTSASGSGDGCGTSWPLCGQLVAEGGPSRYTLIEFFHRITSGLSLLGVVGLFVLARQRYPVGHPVRTGSGWSLFFMITESLLGAGLVIFAWTNMNLSLARALVQPVHMFNTLLLMGAMGLTIWWAAGNPRISLRSHPALTLMILLSLAGFILISSFGTFASLAGHIFPSESFLDGVRSDFSRDSHYLIRLRIWHPILATLIGFWLVWFSRYINQHYPDPRNETVTLALLAVYGVQYALGFLNAFLLSPIWLQMVHLLLAHAVWLLVMWAGVNALRTSQAATPEPVAIVTPRSV
jgi:heme A synthase